jgi:uncharacterized protein (TIGR04222 family)
MDNPWGISGPDFVWLYIGAFGLALIALFVLRRMGRSGALGRAGHEPLTVEETAYLSGGWLRVVESAVTGLVERNVIRVERNGYIYAVSNPELGPESEVEEAVMRAVDGRTGRTIAQIQRKLAGDPMFDRAHRSLEAQGLSYGGGRAWWSVAPLLVVFVVGVVRLINGIDLGYPVAYLTMLLIITLVVIIFGARPVKPGITKAGRKALAERGCGSGTAAVVARGGLNAHPDKATGKGLRKGRATAYSRSGSSTGGVLWGASSYSGSGCGGTSGCGSSSSSSSSGSSCGGGGCGGGGGS